MAGFMNIALFGAGGTNIGHHIIQALGKDGNYNTTVIARASSKSTFPDSVTVVKVSSFDDHAELVRALTGQDVLISAIGHEAMPIQYKLIDAAIEAGVQRFFPSEWGFDNDSPEGRGLSDVFDAKHVVADYLRSKETVRFGWTAVATGSWLDWALDAKFVGIDPTKHEVRYWRDGAQEFTCTTLAYSAAAVLQILRLPAEQTANKRIYVSPFEASQHQIVAELEKQQGVKYTSVPFDADAALKMAKAKWKAERDVYALYTTIAAAVLLTEYKAGFVTAGKGPVLESMEGVELPKLTLEDVVSEFVKSSPA